MEVVSQTIESPGDLPGNVDLWVLSPNYTTRQYRNPETFGGYVDGLVERSAKDANLILWMTIRRFSDHNFWYPSFDQWIRHGVILSGSGDRTMMGLVYSNSIENRWRARSIWSESGGPKSSQTCRWVVEKIRSSNKKLVCEPYASSHYLAIWCRRASIEYRGYTKNQAVREQIEKELAQFDFPGI